MHHDDYSYLTPMEDSMSGMGLGLHQCRMSYNRSLAMSLKPGKLRHGITKDIALMTATVTNIGDGNDSRLEHRKICRYHSKGGS